MCDAAPELPGNHAAVNDRFDDFKNTPAPPAAPGRG